MRLGLAIFSFASKQPCNWWKVWVRGGHYDAEGSQPIYDWVEAECHDGRCRLPSLMGDVRYVFPDTWTYDNPYPKEVSSKSSTLTHRQPSVTLSQHEGA